MVKGSNERAEFIEQNLGLVHSLCHRFTGRGIEYDDLFQAGSLGLVKATDAFDETRGLCFSTYAVPVILGEIKRLFRDGGAVKVSRSLKELSLKVVRTREKMLLTLGREPTVQELAKELEVDIEDITEAICVAQPTVSLTVENEDGVSELELPCEGPEDALSDRLMLSAAFEILDENEKKIVSCRFFHSMTQSNTARMLSMSQVQVSRAEKKILKKLKNVLSA